VKIKDRFPNFSLGLMYFIEDKNPISGLNDSKRYSFCIPLANFKKGFDFYELILHPSGGAYFSIATMIGFKTIITTTSELYTQDLTQTEWTKIVGNTSNKHFFREEYQALKKGYTKEKGGCMSSLLFSALVLIYVAIYTYDF